MKRAQFAVSVMIAACLMCLGAASHASALSLKIAPLEYKTTLKSSEKQKGYVDISNPTATALNLDLEVQAFRQIDDQGGIEFYDDKAVSAGILLDFNSVELGPREVLRLFFVIDGTKLPSGEVFAAILAHAVPTDGGTTQAVRVGTILEITNGVSGTHHASVTSVSAPFLQIGEGVSANFVVKNDDPSSQTTGFRPQVTVRVRPYSTTEVSGPLVFAGRSRTAAYHASGNYFGLVWLEVGVQGSSKGQWVLLMTGYWRWLVPLMLVSVLSLIGMGLYTRHKKH